MKVVQFSADDKVFFGKLLGINDSVTIGEESIQLLKKALSEAIDDYILICKETEKHPYIN